MREAIKWAVITILLIVGISIVVTPFMIHISTKDGLDAFLTYTMLGLSALWSFASAYATMRIE